MPTALAKKAPVKSSSNGHANSAHNATARLDGSAASVPGVIMEQVNIGLSPKALWANIDMLNQLLADYAVLSVKVHNYHWNVVGINFQDLHKFFDKTYEALNEEIDEIAERTRTLGGRPLGNMAAFIKNSRIKEETREGLSSHEMLVTLLQDEEFLIRCMREDIDKMGDDNKDMTTSDFVTGLTELREKHAWMTRAMCA